MFSKGLVLVNPFGDDMREAVAISEITGNSYIYFDAESGSDSLEVDEVQLTSRQALLLFKGGLKDTSATAISPLSPGSFALYPSPSKEIVHIEFPDHSLSGNHPVELIDITGGRSIVSAEFTHGKTTLDISSMSPGFYFVHLCAQYRPGKLIILK